MYECVEIISLVYYADDIYYIFCIQRMLSRSETQNPDLQKAPILQ